LVSDLASAIANRGLAYWSMGNWRTAEDDFGRAIELIKERAEPDGLSTEPIGVEALIKLSFLYVDVSVS
jgi:hypothetical protein